jgi:diphthamide synthase subunit DPH2
MPRRRWTVINVQAIMQINQKKQKKKEGKVIIMNTFNYYYHKRGIRIVLHQDMLSGYQ